MAKTAKGRVVYSTDPDFPRRCERCERYPCVCPPERPSPPAEKQVARLQRDRRGRAGKTVTVVSGLQLSTADLAVLAKTLKIYCGAGGTVKEGEIEIQGDQRQKIADKLAELGYKVKFVGG